MRKQALILLTALMLVGTASAGSTTPLNDDGSEKGIVEKTSLWLTSISFDTSGDETPPEPSEVDSPEVVGETSIDKDEGMVESMMRSFEITGDGETGDADSVEPGDNVDFRTGFTAPEDWEDGYCDTGVDLWVEDENGEVLDTSTIDSPCEPMSFSVVLDFSVPNSEGTYDYDVYWGDYGKYTCTDDFVCGDQWKSNHDSDSIKVEEPEPEEPDEPEEITVYEQTGSGTDAECVEYTVEEGEEGSNTYDSRTSCENDLPDIEDANAQISGDSEAKIGDTVNFNAAGSTGEGSIDYTWTKDGENIGSGETISHKFEEEGRQNIEVEIEDSEGQTDTASTTLYVDYEEPTAEASSSEETVEVGEELQLDASGSSGGSYNIEEYNWRANGETFTGQRPTYTFEEEGTHTVELEVVDSERNTDRDSVEVTAEKNYEMSNINMEAPRHVTLDDTETLRFLEEEATVEAGVQDVEWQIGETETYTGKEIEHQFRTRGDKEVTMTVIDEEGQERQVEHTITVEEEPPGPIEKVVTWLSDLFS